HEVGIPVAIDEFGTGFLSVTTIESIPVSSLKIDRGYTTAVTSVGADAEAVASTIDLAHGLGLTVTAVGVGDATTLERLAAMGCDHAQGVHLSEPVTFEDLPRRVDELEAAMSTWVGARAVLLEHAD
ncbi:MAG: EAL domain-containing protein, partial [Actinobacteria bacterium]|nr:EAL domain-containing protein [Actinomycetota bacterium]